MNSFFGPKLKQYSALKAFTPLFYSIKLQMWNIILNTITLPHLVIPVNACYAFGGSGKWKDRTSTQVNDRRGIPFSGKQAMTVLWRERAKKQETYLCQAGDRTRKNGKQIYPATRISSREGGSGMASKPELWEKQDDGTVNWEFLMAYERSVLLSLQERGILTQQQYEECIRILERKRM